MHINLYSGIHINLYSFPVNRKETEYRKCIQQCSQSIAIIINYNQLFIVSMFTNNHILC